MVVVFYQALAKHYSCSNTSEIVSLGWSVIGHTQNCTTNPIKRFSSFRTHFTEKTLSYKFLYIQLQIKERLILWTYYGENEKPRVPYSCVYYESYDVQIVFQTH